MHLPTLKTAWTMAKPIHLVKSATALKSCVFKVPSTFSRTDWQHWSSAARSPSTTPKQGRPQQAARLSWEFRLLEHPRWWGRFEVKPQLWNKMCSWFLKLKEMLQPEGRIFMTTLSSQNKGKLSHQDKNKDWATLSPFGVLLHRSACKCYRTCTSLMHIDTAMTHCCCAGTDISACVWVCVYTIQISIFWLHSLFLPFTFHLGLKRA